MNTKEKTKELIRRAYENAKKHGFHNQEWSKEHLLMLILTEVGEMVEADRRSRRANIVSFEKWRDIHGFNYYKTDFEKYVKDTLDDEMSDVAIRLFDLCGAMGLDVEIRNDMGKEFYKMYNEKTFCEKCFILTTILCQSSIVDTNEELEEIISSALTFLFCLAQDMDIDLALQIELKMRYNEEREPLHGKKY